MAQRRMYNLDIVASDAFLEMPISSQALYFHLGMYADDDGFVSPKKIMRLIGASGDDLKVLLGKRFLLTFESGVVVVKHWKMNNYLRPDRYKPTVYIEEKKALTTKENEAYTECLPIDNQMATIGTRSIGKDSVVEGRIGKDRKVKANINCEPSSPEINQLFDIFYEINPTINYGNITQRKSADRLIKKLGVEKTLNSAKAAVVIHGKQYAPTITTPKQLEDKLAELVGFYKKNQSSQIISV